MADRHRLRVTSAALSELGKQISFVCDKPGCDVKGKILTLPRGIADELFEVAARWHNEPIDGDAQ